MHLHRLHIICRQLYIVYIEGAALLQPDLYILYSATLQTLFLEMSHDRNWTGFVIFNRVGASFVHEQTGVVLHLKNLLLTNFEQTSAICGHCGTQPDQTLSMTKYKMNRRDYRTKLREVYL